MLKSSDRCMVIGYSSKIIEELASRVSGKEFLDGLRGKRLSASILSEKHFEDDLKTCDHLVITLGILNNKSLFQQSFKEISKSFFVNLSFVVKSVELGFRTNPNLNVIIIGSESARKGSYDGSYFLAKAALEAYVREKKIHAPGQRINLISPSMIEDANMTTSRKDQKTVIERSQTHPKKRLVSSREIAKMIAWLMEKDSSYISNANIEVNGGKFARH